MAGVDAPAGAAAPRASTASRRRRRTLWLLHQQAGQNTRRTKSQARRTVAGQTGAAESTAAQRLAAWEAQTVHREVHALSAVHQQVARYSKERATGAPAVLDDVAKRTAARIAVAEVQRHHAVWSMAQLRFEVHRALPVLKPGADGEAVVTEVARLAVSGRAGAEVIQVTAPDITDVTSLGVRASDGGSIYRPPNEERYCTLAHLDTEEQILAAAKRTVPQLVSARAGPGRRGAHRAERRAARRRGDDAHRGRGDDRADRPGRGGQEPHDGRVRPAVDHVHRPAGHRPDHLHQRRPGAGSTRAWPRATTSPSSSARPKAPTSCAGPSPAPGRRARAG